MTMSTFRTFRNTIDHNVLLPIPSCYCEAGRDRISVQLFRVVHKVNSGLYSWEVVSDDFSLGDGVGTAFLEDGKLHDQMVDRRL